MQIYFLGTGTSQGIPVIGSNHPVCKSENSKDKRLRVSIWISWENFSFVVDCGPDFRQQMLTSKCAKIDGVLFTHEHADHTAGIDDIRPFNFMHGEIPFFATDLVMQNLMRRFDYVFEIENRYPGAPAVLPVIFDVEKPFAIGDKVAIPIQIMHGNLPIVGYRIGDFAYLTDMKFIEQSQIEKLKGVKLLIISALRIEQHPTHFNLAEALAFIEIIKPEKTYLTHISHFFGFHDDIQMMLPENVFAAYDNLTINI